MAEILIFKIREFIDEKFFKAYTGKSNIKEILDESQNLIMDLYLVQTKVVPCFPPKYDIFNVYKEKYLKNIYDKIQMYTTEKYLEDNKGDLILFAKWLDLFSENLKKVGIDIKTTDIGSVNFLINF
jgi:exocyst complex component 3